MMFFCHRDTVQMFSPEQAVISVWLHVNMGINKQRNRGKDLTCCSRTQGDVLWRLNVLLLRRSWPLVVLLPSFIGNEQSDGARLKSTRSHNYSLEPYDITTETSDIIHYHVLSSERAVLRTLQKKQAKESCYISKTFSFEIVQKRFTDSHATHLHSIFILYIKNIHLYLYLLNLYDCSFTVL